MTSISFDDDDNAATYVQRMSDESEIGTRIKQLRTLKGPMTQEQFAERLGKTTRGAVGNWERGLGIKRENLAAIADRFKVSFEWLASGRGAMDIADGANSHEVVNAIIGDKLASTRNTIPLYGHAVGGEDGEFILNGQQLDNITAPPGLSAARGAYAVTVAGDSMTPRYDDGETVYVDPLKRVVKGNYVVAQIEYDDSKPPLAYIKKFVSHNAKELVLEQFNPPKVLRFPHDNVVSVHFIVMGGTLPSS